MTEGDGQSYCWARAASALGVITYLADATYMLWKTNVLSLTDFATGFATILAGSAALIAAKQATDKNDIQA